MVYISGQHDLTPMKAKTCVTVTKVSCSKQAQSPLFSSLAEQIYYTDWKEVLKMKRKPLLMRALHKSSIYKTQSGSAAPMVAMSRAQGTVREVLLHKVEFSGLQSQQQ